MWPFKKNQESKIVGMLHGLHAKVQAIAHLLGDVMATQAELAQQLTAIGSQITALDSQVNKVAGETAGLKQEILDLKAIIDAGGPITPDLQSAADSLATKAGALQSSVQTLDDMVPDPPTP